MKNILLPTDFSENSWNAIKYALQLFKDETCKFYLLNTYTPVIYHVEYVVIEPTQLGILDNVRETSLKNLQDFKTRMESEFKNPKHNIETIGAFNMLIPEIVDVVKNKAINYVVMGTKGATGASEILFGSNTVHVFKSVKCPILAIPNGFEFEKPHEILFPTDYEIDYKPYHLKSIIEIASLFKTRVNVLNASYGYELTENQEKNKNTLEGYLKKTTYLCHSVNNQNVTQAITKFQLKTRVNFLVMINNKHSFFENLFFKSTINQIGFHLKIPFLVISEKP